MPLSKLIVKTWYIVNKTNVQVRFCLQATVHNVCLSRDIKRWGKADTIGSGYTDLDTRHLSPWKACKGKDEGDKRLGPDTLVRVR